MKKIFLAIAIAVSSLSMMAQAGSDKSVQDSCCNVNNIENCNPGQACANPQNCNQANCNANECAACPGPQNCDNPNYCGVPRNRAYNKRQCNLRNQLEGLGLTDGQKKKIDELFKANAQAGVSSKKDYQNGKKLNSEQRKQLKNDFRAKRIEGRKKILADIKTVLTPEQYTAFLENNYLEGGNSNLKNKNFHHGKRHKKGHGNFAHRRGEHCNPTR